MVTKVFKGYFQKFQPLSQLNIYNYPQNYTKRASSPNDKLSTVHCIEITRFIGYNNNIPAG